VREAALSRNWATINVVIAPPRRSCLRIMIRHSDRLLSDLLLSVVRLACLAGAPGARDARPGSACSQHHAPTHDTGFSRAVEVDFAPVGRPGSDERASKGAALPAGLAPRVLLSGLFRARCRR